MSTYTRRTIASDHAVLEAINAFVSGKYRKAQISQEGSTVVVRRKVLWQKQETRFDVVDGLFTATGNCDDADRISRRVMEEIDGFLNDHGWKEASTALGLHSIGRDKHAQGLILDLIAPDERVLVAISGYHDGKKTVLASTQRRVVMVQRELFGGEGTSQTIDLGQISGVTEKTGIVDGSVRIATSNHEVILEKAPSDEVKTFVATVRKQLAESTSRARSESSPGGDVSNIKQLAELHAAGALTDEEFAAAKAKLLGI